MKQKDILALVGVAFVAAIIAYVISGAIFSSKSKESSTVPVVQAIDPNFPHVQDDKSYTVIFNPNAIDPTQLIKIGQNQNNTPFNQPTN